PLTGRTRTYRLFPVAIKELRTQNSRFELNQKLNHFLLFGLYPEVIGLSSVSEKIELLRELTSSYLYKDVLQLSSIKHSDKIYRLLKMLALQLGAPVSLHEIGQALEMSHNTVGNYIDLLEKGFVIFRLGGYSNNLRKEMNKMNKIYFYDLGIRNMLINNFNSLENRLDVGALWENFLIVERMKKLEYEPIFANSYFWRQYSGAELDYVEQKDGQLFGFEFKYGKKKPKPPKSWLATYKEASYQLVNRENYLDFIL
ncbi:MAG: DUF4143 domain-containing protein, partial [Bacteroidota bacterium]